MKNGKKQQKPRKIQGIIGDYLENLQSNKLGNLEEMYKFLDTYDHPKLNQEDINNLNRSVTSSEIEAAIKSLPKNKSPRPAEFTAEFYQTFKEELISTLLKFSTKYKGKEHCQTHSMKTVLHSFPNQKR
jgi:glutamyl-tRNA reductase